VKAILTRSVAILASSLLLFAGLLISAPANAAAYTVSVTIKTNGVPDPDGHFLAYTYQNAYKSWENYDDAASDVSGVAQLSLDPANTYRFCYHSDASDLFEELCYGGDTVDEATSVTLNSDLNLGTIDLQPRKPVDMSGLRIQGKAVVGQRLTVDLSSMPAGVNYIEIEWYRDGFVMGGDVVGQWLSHGNTYVIKQSDVGHTITARISADGPRFISHEYLSGGAPFVVPAVGPVVLPMGFSSAPKVKAKKWKKGNIASYVAPTVTPPGATATFQWLRNGKAIKGAKNATYKIKKADRKKKLTLRVTYTYGGYETTTMQTPPSPKIK
jgi:hypothetical protein